MSFSDFIKDNSNKGDRFLLLTDGLLKTEKFEKLLSENSVIYSKFEMKPTGRHGKEPESSVFEKIIENDFVFAITKYSLTHTDCSINASKKGIKIVSMPGFSEEMVKAIDTNYNFITKKSEEVSDRIRSSFINITTDSGRLTLSTKDCPIKIDDGDLNKNKIINLPSGEVFLPPREMEGSFKINTGDFEGSSLFIEDNMLKKTDNKKLEELLTVDKNSHKVAELGIGVNPDAFITGKILMDEKVMGTCHIAFGDNIGFGGNNKSSLHYDIVIQKPKLISDKKIILENGELR